MVSATKK